MNVEKAEASEANAIRALIEDWAAALRNKDIDGIVSLCAPDILAFDCHSRLQFDGVDAYRTHLEACLPCMQGPMSFEIDDLSIATHGDVAFCHYLAHVGATGSDGEEHLARLRATVCFRKRGGEWLITHAHCSAPFDPQSGRAMLDATA